MPRAAKPTPTGPPYHPGDLWSHTRISKACMHGVRHISFGSSAYALSLAAMPCEAGGLETVQRVAMTDAPRRSACPTWAMKYANDRRPVEKTACPCTPTDPSRWNTCKSAKQSCWCVLGEHRGGVRGRWPNLFRRAGVSPSCGALGARPHFESHAPNAICSWALPSACPPPPSLPRSGHVVPPHSPPWGRGT